MYLLNQECVFPRLAHAILDLLPTGERQTLAGMVETTKTIIKRAVEVGTIGECDLSGLLAYEDVQLNQFIAVLNSNTADFRHKDLDEKCSVTIDPCHQGGLWASLMSDLTQMKAQY